MPPTPPNAATRTALDVILSSLENLSDAVAKLDVSSDVVLENAGRIDDPFSGLIGTPHLDVLKPGIALLADQQRDRLRQAITLARNDREQLAAVMAIVAQISAGIAKGLL